MSSVSQIENFILNILFTVQLQFHTTVHDNVHMTATTRAYICLLYTIPYTIPAMLRIFRGSCELYRRALELMRQRID